MNPDTTGTDTTGTDTIPTGTPVPIAEIADFLRQLRALSGSPAAAAGLARDTTTERAAFLARKADLFARIAAQHPDLAPTTTAPTTTAQPDGGGA